MLTTLVLFAALQAGASPVDPRDPFAGLLRAMERDGFEIKETQEVAGAGGRQLAATFRKTSDTDGSREELHVYVESAGGPKLVHRRAADVSAFWLAGFQDVTGDGIPELVVRFSCGGAAWRCQRLGVLQIRGEEVVELTRLIRGTLFPSALADLDGDGVPELVVSDSRWETYPELDHVNAPRLERIFRWTGTGYEHASALFPQRALERIDETRRRLESTSLPFDYMSAAVTLLLHHRDIGRGEEGWAEFERRMTSAPPAVVRTRLWNGDKVLEDFRPAHIGVYQPGAELTGVWRLLGRTGDGAIAARLSLEEDDEAVSALLEIDGHSLTGRGSTDGIQFSLDLIHADGTGPEHADRLMLSGRLEGTALTGEWSDGASSGTWTAERIAR